MHITDETLTQFSNYLAQRGLSPASIATYVSVVRSAVEHLGPTWTEDISFSAFVSASPAVNTQWTRKTRLNKFIRWARAKGLTTLPLIDLAIAAKERDDTTAIDLTAITAQIHAADLPSDLRAIFLLHAECGLRTGEILALDVYNVTDQAAMLLVSGRSYPLNHVPQTQTALAAWLQERPAATTPAVFVTRQQGRRTLPSLRPWWKQVVGADGPTLNQVQQARADALKREYPDVADALLGYANAPEITADELRAALEP